MSETKERISISAYAKLKRKKLFWTLPIARLYSIAEYWKNDSGGIESEPRYRPTFCGGTLLESGGSASGQKSACSYPSMKFHIAVKELIIEWNDYQAEVSGYIHCESCVDIVDQSYFYVMHIKMSRIMRMKIIIRSRSFVL